MRIVLAGPPKTGNVWVERILATAYGLRSIDAPPLIQDGVEGIRQFVERGGFPDGTIFHQHFRHSDEFVALMDDLTASIVTVLRDPYDTFVSLYFYIQRFSENYPVKSPARAVAGKPLDAPETLRFLERNFGHHLDMASQWLRSGRSVVVRYEDMHADPVGETKRLTDRIEPVDQATVERAVAAADSRSMKQENRTLKKHIRSATVGDWRNHLTEVHLDIFRRAHAERLAALGYAVH